MVTSTGPAMTSSVVQELPFTISAAAPSTTKRGRSVNRSTGRHWHRRCSPCDGSASWHRLPCVSPTEAPTHASSSSNRIDTNLLIPNPGIPKAELQSHEYRELGVPGSNEYGGGIHSHEMRGQSDQWELEARELPAYQSYHVTR